MFDRAPGGLTRRQLLVRGGALAAGLSALPLLSACSSAPASRDSVGGTLNMLTWEGYDIPKESQDWRSSNGVDLRATYVGSNDELVTKTAAAAKSGGSVDVITYGPGYLSRFDDLGLLAPIDTSKLSNYEQLFPFFRSQYKNFWVKPDGQVYGVPYTFNWNGITYDSAVTGAPDTYDVLFDSKWTGKVAITDDASTIYQIAAHAQGIDPTQMDASAFQKVESWISGLLKQTKGISPTYGDMVTKLVSGDAVFTFPGWAGSNVLAAQSGKSTVKSLLPREGGVSSTDSWAIPKNSTNVPTAYAWINYTLQPKIAVATATALSGGTPVAAAVPDLPADVKAGYDYSNIDALFAKAPLFPLFPLKSDKFKTLDDVLASWTQLKAGG